MTKIKKCSNCGIEVKKGEGGQYVSRTFPLERISENFYCDLCGLEVFRGGN